MRVFGMATKKGIASLFFLLGTVAVFGQPTLLPPPDFVKVAVQSDSPIEITVNRREARGNFNPVYYSVRNVSEKVILAFVVTGFPKDPVHVVGNNPLHPGATNGFLLHGDLEARKPGETFVLTVDYVFFADGTRWGADTAGESEFIDGVLEGQKTFRDQLKRLIDQNDNERLEAFFNDTSSLVGAGPNDRPSKRKDGFRRGYNFWVNTIRAEIQNTGNLKSIPTKLADVELALGIQRQTAPGIRLISRTGYPNEPLAFKSIRLRKRQIDFDVEFVEPIDWLKGLSIELTNRSTKTITYISLNLLFPETVEKGNVMSFPLTYGRHSVFAQAGRDNEPPIKPGETLVLTLDEVQYSHLKRFIESRQQFDGLTRMNIGNFSVSFDDETGWSIGQNMKRDPFDPNRMIPEN